MRLTFFLFGLLSSTIIVAQSPILPLNFSSYAIKLGVSKDENLTLTTRMGEIGVTSSINDSWHRADFLKERTSSGVTLDQSIFFNKDKGFVSGFISSKSGKYDIIYHTTNGGLKWNAINFGEDGWVDDATNLDNGEAWLSVGGRGIVYTAD